MHGTGNDYIFINGFNQVPGNLSDLSIKMSDRHKGIGGDGLVVILPSEVADFKMRMFNSDGSEGRMCGNASRCIAKYVFENGLTSKTKITLETLAGIKIIRLHIDNDVINEITVDMGEPSFVPCQIPVNAPADVVNRPIQTSAGVFYITAVSMGNPHGVVFINEDVNDFDVFHNGQELEFNQLFPQRANIEFVNVASKKQLNIRVWERGSGETLACGTGACASVVAGVLLGKCDRNCDVTFRGGTLNILWDELDNHVYMTGPAEFICDGVYYYK